MPFSRQPAPITSPSPSASTRADTALRVVDNISALVAYWDSEERCRFANDAYRQWFGRKTADMPGMRLQDLLGPLYERNLPYIRGALSGESQVFERMIPRPDGTSLDSIATYTPDIVDGKVRGFSVHVADVTRLRQRELALAGSIRETIRILEKTKSSFRSKELGQLRVHLQEVLSRLEGR